MITLISKHNWFSLAILPLMLSLAGCEPNPTHQSITLIPTYNNAIVTCESKFGISQNLKLSQIQLYLSEMTLITDTQQLSVPFKVDQSQSDQVALVGGDCSSKFNWDITFESPINATEILAVEFTIGVPFKLNHHNPLLAKPPLNNSDMFWSWQLGHKFLRLELTAPNTDWLFHLGSTGCKSASPVRAPKVTCKNPNQSRIELTNFDVQKPIIIDLSVLLDGINLNSDNSCQSSLNTPSCQILLQRLAIKGKQQFIYQNKIN